MKAILIKKLTIEDYNNDIYSLWADYKISILNNNIEECEDFYITNWELEKQKELAKNEWYEIKFC